MFIEYAGNEVPVVKKSFMDKKYERVGKGLYIGEVAFIQSDDDENTYYRVYHCYTVADDEGDYYATECDVYGHELD